MESVNLNKFKNLESSVITNVEAIDDIYGFIEQLGTDFASLKEENNKLRSNQRYFSNKIRDLTKALFEINHKTSVNKDQISSLEVRICNLEEEIVFLCDSFQKLLI